MMKKFSIQHQASFSELFRKYKYIAIPLIFILCASLVVFLAKYVSDINNHDNAFYHETILEVSPFIGELDGSCNVKSEDSSISEAKIETDRGFPGYSFVIYFYRPGVNKITLSKGDTTVVFETIIDEDRNVQIRRAQS